MLDELLEEAFAVAREASVRALGMRPFDVQLIGGMVLHQGKIAEMKTGEGKTLVATMPVYLNALTGRGVHVVTVNDYLARRDAEWMGRIYRFLGLTVGCIQNDLLDEERQAAYACDVTYGTNNEFGFDYLRDNMKFELESMVQRGHVFAIVDEVDSILIDEARTPLIISGPSEENTDIYYKCNRIIPHLVKGDRGEGQARQQDHDRRLPRRREVAHRRPDRGGRREGREAPRRREPLRPDNIDSLHGVEQALRAHALYKRDVDYMIKDGQVLIVDEFTGRVMPGRRWSDGLHQAVEAKENVKIERENQTLATITLQNYFRMYEKLAGMTGTADTEAAEFHQIYKLDVVVIPTNKPMIRDDHQDVVYGTEREKYEAVAEEIVELREKGQPVLVGTVSIEKSELLSDHLKKRKVPHVVLNAKYHEKEAEIVAQAGRSGAVTIATNMAGRGTDILLGGNPEALAEPGAQGDRGSRRARAQLAKLRETLRRRQADGARARRPPHHRHRAPRVPPHRQPAPRPRRPPGRPGLLALLPLARGRPDADLRLRPPADIMRRLGMEEGVPIEHGMVTRSIERAQKQVEGRNFETRKHLLEYDDVMNQQREEIYRHEAGDPDRRQGRGVRHRPRRDDPRLRPRPAPLRRQGPRGVGPRRGRHDLQEYFGIKPGTIAYEGQNREQIRDAILETMRGIYDRKESILGDELMRTHEKFVMLQVVDQQWKDHLLALDHLKEGIGLRGYGQRDPLIEYKKESFELFTLMKERIEDLIVQYLFKLQPVPARRSRPRARRARLLRPGEPRSRCPSRRAPSNVNYSYGAAASGGQDAKVETVQRNQPKVGRNDPARADRGRSSRSATEPREGLRRERPRRWAPEPRSNAAAPQARERARRGHPARAHVRRRPAASRPLRRPPPRGRPARRA